MAIFTSRALGFLLPNFSFQGEGARTWAAFRSHAGVWGVSLGEKGAGSCFGNITASGHPASSSPCQQSQTLSLISDMFAKKEKPHALFFGQRLKGRNSQTYAPGRPPSASSHSLEKTLQASDQLPHWALAGSALR